MGENLEIQPLINKLEVHAHRNYDVLLDSLNIPFNWIGDNFLLIGTNEDRPVEVYVSVVVSQIYILLEELSGSIIKDGVACIIPYNYQVAKMILQGHYGNENIGKVFTLYFLNENHAKEFLTCHSLEAYQGPVIPELKQIFVNVYCSRKLFLSVDAIGDDIRKSKNIDDRFRPIATLKMDAKGKVMKSYFLKELTSLKICLLKEGNRYMWSDQYGRDIIDRIRWQYYVHQTVSADINVPKVLDYFSEHGNAYIAMEFIQGTSLNSMLFNYYNSLSWMALEVDTKRKVIDSVLKAVRLIHEFHILGFIHRDITTANFIEDKKGEMYLIDFELSAGVLSSDPPFELGTRGFMSPEQEHAEAPEISQDIYSLGCLMIISFTGMPAYKFNLEKSTYLKSTLLYFIRHRPLVELILKCLDPDSDRRPATNEIISELLSYYNNCSNIDFSRIEEFCLEAKYELQLIGLFNCFCFEYGYCQLKKSLQIPELNGHFSDSDQEFNRFLLTDILYMFHVSPAKEHYLYEKLKKFVCVYNNNLEKYPVANLSEVGKHLLTIDLSYSLNLIIPSKLGKVNRKASLDTEKISLRDGLAGYIFYAAESREVANNSELGEFLNIAVTEILRRQQRDGLWSNELKGDDSIISGNAGILLALTNIYKLTSDLKVKDSIIKGALKLQKLKFRERIQRLFKPRSKNVFLEFSLYYGLLGKAFLNIHLYECFNIGSFKLTAEIFLRRVPRDVWSEDFSVSTGMAGIGLGFLEAYRVFKDDEWLIRALRIQDLLSSTIYIMNDEVSYWENAVKGGLDLGYSTGNAGIVTFHMLCNQAKLGPGHMKRVFYF